MPSATHPPVRPEALDPGASAKVSSGRPWAPARIVTLAALGVLAGGLAACGSGAGASTASSTTSSAGAPNCASVAPKITVQADGSASATPDTLTISMGIQVSDGTAAAALSDANGQATTLTGSLKASGVTPGDVRSTDFSIAPTYTPSGQITGYQVANTLLVTMHDLGAAGQVIDTAAASVGNAIRVNGLTFSVSNTGGVDGQARADAVTAAAAHARAMAKAAGASLGGICSVSDTTAGPVPLDQTGTFNTSSGAPALPVPLEPGTQQASAEVTVVYALGPK